MSPGWESSARTHVGKRRETNEDAVLANPELGLWVVADGMGGHAFGDLASQAVTSALGRIEDPGDLVALVDLVDDALLRVNTELVRKAANLERGETMGSTVVVMLADESMGVALWAGDSRLYRLREGNVELITRDHNPFVDLWDETLAQPSGFIDADTNVVTRAIGGSSDVTLDVALFDICDGDTYLLCSDGLYREIDEVDLPRFLSGAEVDCVTEELIAASLAGDARDNISAIVSRRTETR